jgi:voltage-gated potassium channel
VHQEAERVAARERYEIARDAVDGPMVVLSVVMLGLVVADVALPLSPALRSAVSAGQWVIWAAFALEYLAFLLLAPDKGEYVRKNLFSLLTVVLPFLRVFRALRAVRAVRALRAVRVANLTRRGAVQLRMLLQWSSFAYFATVALMVTFLGAAAVLALEEGSAEAGINSYGQAVWWAVGVVTTIGSSLEPVTFEGRLLAAGLYLLGMSVPAYLGGVIAASLIGRQSQDAVAAETAGGLEAKLDLVLERLQRLEEGGSRGPTLGSSRE